MAKYEATIKTLWAIAKSPELRLTGEELHLLVEANTGKTSMKDLTKREIRSMAAVLNQMKDSAIGRKTHQKTGNTGTENQRKKVYCLMKELGWNPERVNGLCKKMFKVERVEWLNYRQCSDLIEALKGMLEREKEKKGEVDAGQGLCADPEY